MSKKRRRAVRSLGSHVELRSVVAEVRMIAGDDGKEKIRGYAAVFNSPSEVMSTEDGQRFVERIKPGAFARSLADSDVRATFNHNRDLVLGRRGAGTLRCWEDERGLAYEISPTDTSVARDVMAWIRSKDIPGSSFTFATIEDDWSEVDGMLSRELLAVHVFELGPVLDPAYRSTSATCRSLERFVEARAKSQIVYPTTEQITLLNHFRLAEFPA